MLRPVWSVFATQIEMIYLKKKKKNNFDSCCNGDECLGTGSKHVLCLILDEWDNVRFDGRDDDVGVVHEFLIVVQSLAARWSSLKSLIFQTGFVKTLEIAVFLFSIYTFLI